LLYDEFSYLIDIIIEGDLLQKKENIIKENILKINSESSRKRVLSEVFKRVQSVPSNLWKFYKTLSDSEKRVLLFYVCLKTYSLLLDFQSEVVLNKHRSFNYELTKNDIDVFFAKKSQVHPEIEVWTESTKEKIKSTILLLLRQAGIMKDNKITPIQIPLSFWKGFLTVGEAWFLELCLLNKNERDQILGME